MSSNQRKIVNFIRSDGVDIAQEWITKDYLISVYPSIGQQIGIPPELWVWGSETDGRLGDGGTTGNTSTPITTFSGGTSWKQVGAGTSHITALKTDGTLWSWGNGQGGKLGTNSTSNSSTPAIVFGAVNTWKYVSSGDVHTAAIAGNNTLWIWGNDSVVPLNRYAETLASTPVTTFAGGTNWADTANDLPEELYTIGSSFIGGAAIKTDGTLWTWGNNSNGQLGNASTDSAPTPITTFAGGTNWKQVSGGASHTVAIKTDGTLWTWGNGSSGRLGNASTVNVSTPVTTFAGGTDWKQVSGGASHTAAIKTDGTLWTWGSASGFGVLGNGATTGTISTPVTTFAGGTDWKQVSACSSFAATSTTAAIKTDGTLWTWGSTTNGQLGNAVTGTATSNRSTPVTTFAGGTDWKQVSASLLHMSAIKTDGTLWTWGNANLGRLGNNLTTSINRSTPLTTFAGGTDWKQVTTGLDSCSAVKTDGTLWAWGNNNSTFGNGNAQTLSSGLAATPITTFAGGTNWKQVHRASSTTVTALKSDGTLWVWGNVNNINNGFYPNPSVPGQAYNDDTFDWQQVSAGYRHTSAIKTDGTLWIWGLGDNGKLGTNSTIVQSTAVTTFAGGTNWKQVSCGKEHTAAVKTDGTLWTWGLENNGRLGDGSTTGSALTPSTTFAGGTNWKQVSCGDSHTVAIKTDGTLWSWGNNASVQLGINNTTSMSTPVTIFSGGTNWKAVHTENLHTVALKTDGTLWIWGSGTSGELGNTTILNRSTPVTTFVGGTNWKQASAGGSHTAAIKSVDF